MVRPATANTHVSRAMLELGVRDRARLAVLAYETGLVKPGWPAWDRRAGSAGAEGDGAWLSPSGDGRGTSAAHGRSIVNVAPLPTAPVAVIVPP